MQVWVGSDNGESSQADQGVSLGLSPEAGWGMQDEPTAPQPPASHPQETKGRPRQTPPTPPQGHTLPARTSVYIYMYKWGKID